jgi:hypothetical protein
MALAAAHAAAQPPPPVQRPGAGTAQGARGGDTSDSAWIRVELAWIADPVVCPYYPTATIQDGMLEVSGYVPDAQVRDRALELARQHCGLPVLDRLNVQRCVVVRRPPVPAAVLEGAASAAVEADFPAYRGLVQVACSPDQRLAVAGAVRSEEQKLLVSQRLRRVAGCVAVVNLLEVRGPEDEAAPPSPWAGRPLPIMGEPGGVVHAVMSGPDALPPPGGQPPCSEVLVSFESIAPPQASAPSAPQADLGPACGPAPEPVRAGRRELPAAVTCMAYLLPMGAEALAAGIADTASAPPRNRGPANLPAAGPPLGQPSTRSPARLREEREGGKAVQPTCNHLPKLPEGGPAPLPRSLPASAGASEGERRAQPAGARLPQLRAAVASPAPPDRIPCPVRAEAGERNRPPRPGEQSADSGAEKDPAEMARTPVLAALGTFAVTCLATVLSIRRRSRRARTPSEAQRVDFVRRPGSACLVPASNGQPRLPPAGHRRDVPGRCEDRV